MADTYVSILHQIHFGVLQIWVSDIDISSSSFHIIFIIYALQHINCKFSDNDGAGTGVDGGGDSGGRIQILFHTKLSKNYIRTSSYSNPIIIIWIFASPSNPLWLLAMDPVGTSYGLTVCLTHLMNESILNALLRSCFQIYGALVREDVVVS